MKKKVLRIVVIVILIFSVTALVFLVEILRKRNMKDSLKANFRKELKTHNHKIKHKDFAVIIDFNLPVYARRLWLLDLRNDEVLLNTHVSHALQSGHLFAKDLSNVPQSYKSSAGSFVFQNDYQVKFGDSMLIEWLIQQING